jgi:2-oxoglutarate ferredoxin oxidoreductase subunit gamma
VMKNIRFEMRIAGFGGQGVVTIGRILGEAFAIYEGKNSVNTQSYGPEARGGACRSEVVVSDGEIHYPNVRKADLFIALSQVALDTYIADLKEGGILIVDPHSVKKVPDRTKYRVYEVPTMEIAHRIGGVKFQNSVALGALYPLIAHMIRESSLRQAISKNVPPKTVEINMKAFERGVHYGKEDTAP